MLKFQREPLSIQLLDEMLPLLVKHYKEIAHYQDIPLEPDYDSYLRMESMDMVRAYTARRDGVLIGYAVFFLNKSIHCKSSKQAVQDVLYIDPSQRGFGYKFIMWCDIQLKEDKVQVVYNHVNAKHNYSSLLLKQDYELIDLIYGKRLI